MAGQQIDPGRIGAPTQLLAALVALLVVVVPAWVTGAATISSPSWVPAMLGTGSVAIVPFMIAVIYRLITHDRDKIVNDETYVKVNKQSKDVGGNLERIGVDSDSLVKGTARIDSEAHERLSMLLATMSRLQDQGVSASALPPDALLNAAKGLMAEKRWADAAQYFDRYVERVDSDWKIQFTRGVAHANARAGAPSNLAALRAYNEAIALTPDDVDQNMRARLYTYRGAIEKRLGRLGPAEHDLLLAQSWATNHYERKDAAYNLACVYAMSGRKTEALQELRNLLELGGLQLINAHLDDYFRSLVDDPEFRRLIRLPSQTDTPRTNAT